MNEEIKKALGRAVQDLTEEQFCERLEAWARVDEMAKFYEERKANGASLRWQANRLYAELIGQAPHIDEFDGMPEEPIR